MLFNIDGITLSIAPGETVRTLCPRCNGGSSGERSLVVSGFEDTTVKWLCHRASCNFRGFTLSDSSQELNSAVKRWTPPEVYAEDLKTEAATSGNASFQVELWQKCRELFPCFGDEGTERFLASQEVKVLSDYDGFGSLYFTARNVWGDFIGAHTRGRNPDATKRVRTYRSRGYEGPLYARFFGADPEHETHNLWLVEDPFSALRIAYWGYDAIALLGTNIPAELLTDAKRRGFKRFYLALDRDATSMALSKAWELGQDTDSSILPVLLWHDLKDMRACDALRIIQAYDR